MQLIAKLVQVMSPITGQGKNGEWKKQDIILETDGQYPKKVCVTVWGDKLANVNLNPGTLLTVDFDIESREYNSKWYTDLKAWRVSSGGTKPASTDNSFGTPPPEFPPFDEDLPF